MSSLIEKTNAVHRISTAYHPQTNGLVERFNQTIQQMILKICNEDQNDWDIFLPELLFSYRTMVHKTTKQTPFSVMFGRPFSGIEQPLIDLNNNNASDYVGGLKFITDLRESVIINSKKNVTESQEKQKKQYAKKRKVDSKSDKIKKGDKVLLFNTRKWSSKGSKMEKSWKGPYEVHDISDKGVATLT
jgi:transposase InsO family protein